MIVGSGAGNPVVWEDGKMTVLDSMFGEAMAVNDRGQIVGRGMVSGSYHAFLREDGEMLDLGTLGGRQSRPMDINNQTQIVGDLDDAEHAFLWEDGELTDLGTLTVDRACEYDTCSQLNAVREPRRRGGIYQIAAMAGAVNARLLIQIFPQEEIEWEEFSNFGNAERNLVDRGVRLIIW